MNGTVQAHAGADATNERVSAAANRFTAASIAVVSVCNRRSDAQIVRV